MPVAREVQVHLLPDLMPPGRLSGALALVIDVLRATTTMVHALAAGCTAIRPCLTVEEATELANQMPVGRVLLGGERHGKPLPGFDMGNSPCEYISEVCSGATLVMTTTNGTRALLRCADAERILIAAFVNYSAVCEQIRPDPRPLHIVCAGTDGAVTMEDVILAGAFVEYLCEEMDVTLNDSARLAWDAFENHGRCLLGSLQLSQGGENLRQLGFDADIRAAAEVDRFAIVPEVRRNPLRIEVGSAGILDKHWPL